jgi:DNA-binding GntR family transcriptional regulator
VTDEALRTISARDGIDPVAAVLEGPGSGRVTARPLERPSTSEALARELRRQILSGAVRSGTRLREVEIAEMFGVSRQSLRAALAELVHEGLLRRAPHRGVWVPALTPDELEDVYYLRGVLEAEAAGRLSRDPEHLVAVHEELERFAALDDDVPWGVAQEAHLAFHRSLVDAVGSPRLTRAYWQLWSEASLALVASRDHPTAAWRARADSHRQLMRAIVAGPPDAAARAARDHLSIGLRTALAAARPS